MSSLPQAVTWKKSGRDLSECTTVVPHRSPRKGQCISIISILSHSHNLILNLDVGFLIAQLGLAAVLLFSSLSVLPHIFFQLAVNVDIFVNFND